MSDCAVSCRDGRLQVVGDMNIYNVAAIKEPVFALVADGGDIEIDLSGVTALDTAGLQVLLMLRRLAHARGAAFHLVSASAAAVEVLDLCGLRSLVARTALGEQAS